MAGLTKEKLESIISQATDTYIKHYESEIKYVQEKSNLTLWIVGLSIGMELFVLNKLDSKDLPNYTNTILLIFTGTIFLVNTFLGLIIRLKQTRLYSHLLKVITLYNYQRTHILLIMDESTSLGKIIISDFSEGIALNKLKDLEYLNQKGEKNDPVIQYDLNLLHQSDNVPSTLLVIQAILTAILLIKII